MRPWVKLPTGINNDPLMVGLTWEQRGFWGAMLALAGQWERQPDDLGALELDTVKHVAWSLRCDEYQLETALRELQRSGFGELRDGIVYVRQPYDVAPSGTMRPAAMVIAWRDTIFSRDNYTCQVCGERGGKLNAHHIEPWFSSPSQRFSLDNGITLCESCHRDMHRKGWKKAFNG
jgi:hypothetical protein